MTIAFPFDTIINLMAFLLLSKTAVTKKKWMQLDFGLKHRSYFVKETKATEMNNVVQKGRVMVMKASPKSGLVFLNICRPILDVES